MQAICMRMVEVRRLTEKPDVPIIIVTYASAGRNTPPMDTLRWIAQHMTPANGSQITTTPEEQMLLLTILNSNSKRLSSDFKAEYQKKRVQGEEERLFFFSFLLPMGPLSHEDLAKLTKTEGCVVCEKKGVSKCSGCLAVEYCGSECQKLHWKEHKSLCKTLTGAKFHPLKFNYETEDIRIANMLGIPLAATGVSTRAMKTPDIENSTRFTDPNHPKGPPPNIHGNNPFLIKVQRNRVKEDGEMIIHDRKRSFEAYLTRGGRRGGPEDGWLEGYYPSMRDLPSVDELAKMLKDMEIKGGKGTGTVTDTEAWEKARVAFREEDEELKKSGGGQPTNPMFPWATGTGKIYRYARRKGVNELEVCWDRNPEKTPVW
ncbi:hypothetical protein D9758_015386 [Tetrapyrgos nigripes]|uniref:MYND-type domain-containing protein n=1 Tax=Tetrapyrgos nigripes TaxID=182062 RepID=A0A8H5FIS8_9AGAR|nr:hypothetical protein D9758_015386 [Tetrapyrgos nigripes]